jgi:hypothetical protein
MRTENRIVEMSVLEARDELTWREYLRVLDNALGWHLGEAL